MRSWRAVILTAALLGGLAAAGYWFREAWWPQPPTPEVTDANPAAPTDRVLLSDEAIANLGLTAQPLKARSFWRTLAVPGMVVDRPGRSDRGVVAPATGVVAAIHHVPGDTVRPGEPLVTLRLVSEALHLTQSELFKTAQDLQLAKAQRQRLANTPGAVSEARLIEVDNQITRLEAAARAYRQELQARGLSTEQVAAAAEGKFVREMVLAVPGVETLAEAAPSLEVQDLKAELGQQVQAGQLVCVLANHRLLAVEGRAFPDETPLLERAVQHGWPVEVDFQEPAGAGWPPLGQTFLIAHLANTIDPTNRTFAFLIPLENQSRPVERGGRTQMLWRFRPGQRVRLRVPVEELANVFVLPPEAVARDGPEAFVFTQNVNTFLRKPVRVLVQERQQVVVANDGSFPPGVYVAQNAAAQLNRLLKAQTSTVPKGYHVHADGSLHKNGEPE
jgi:biotin carboxyl carrier protein